MHLNPLSLYSPPGKRRYNIKLWKTFTDCFNCLPVAAIVDEKILCMHGGLSPELLNMEQVGRGCLIWCVSMCMGGVCVWLCIWNAHNIHNPPSSLDQAHHAPNGHPGHRPAVRPAVGRP
ncbi:hypothetical protein EON64_08410 [archaeon]|nr:MAG: hypothetical protein EON64_08410 [archaeon]